MVMCSQVQKRIELGIYIYFNFLSKMSVSCSEKFTFSALHVCDRVFVCGKDGLVVLNYYT